MDKQVRTRDYGHGAIKRPSWITLFFTLCATLLVLCSAAFAQDKIGIAPFKVFGPYEQQYLKDALPQMLSSRLSYGIKEILGKDTLKDALKGFEGKDELSQAKKISESLDYQYLVLGSYTKMGDAFSLDLKVLKKGSAEFKTFFVSMDRESKLFPAIDELSGQVAAFMEGREYRPKVSFSEAKSASEKFKRLKAVELNYGPSGICLGDIDGDGKKELIAGGNGIVYVYGILDIKLNQLYTYDLKGYEILSVNCGDFNKNGKDEIYVTAIHLEDAVTIIFEGSEGGKLLKQHQTDWYIRVINHPQEGDLLLGQRMGSNDPFYGDIYRLDYKASGIFAKAPFETKKQLNIYQIQPIKYKGKITLAYFDEGDYFKILDDKGKVQERLKDKYGGSMQGVVKGVDDVREKKFASLYQRAERSDAGETDTLYVLKNEGSRFFIRSKKFDRGQAAFLTFDEVGYKEAALSEVIDGYLSDFALDKKDGRVYVSVITENKEGRIYILQGVR